MTAPTDPYRQRAEQLVADFEETIEPGLVIPRRRLLTLAIVEVLRAAVEEEREACASVAAAYGKGVTAPSEHGIIARVRSSIADCIRRRNERAPTAGEKE